MLIARKIQLRTSHVSRIALTTDSRCLALRIVTRAKVGSSYIQVVLHLEEDKALDIGYEDGQPTLADRREARCHKTGT